jgi:hypothetical protein
MTIPATGAVLILAGSLLAESEKITVFVVGVIGVCALADVAPTRTITSQSHMIERE